MNTTTRRWRVPVIVLSACLLLALMGLLLATLAFSYVSDPDDVRCRAASTLVERANDNDETWDDVDLDGATVDDLSCDEAVALAEQIPTEEDSDDTVTIPGASEVRSQGYVLAVIALVQVGGAIGTVWSGRRAARTVAVVGASLGILVQLFGAVSLIATAFILYALLFSRAARALWGRGRPPRATGGDAGQPLDDGVIDTDGVEVVDADAPTDDAWDDPRPGDIERRPDAD